MLERNSDYWSPYYPLIAQDNMLPSKYMKNFITITFCYLINILFCILTRLDLEDLCSLGEPYKFEESA